MTATTDRRVTTFSDGRQLVLDENRDLLNAIVAEQWDKAGSVILSAHAVFVIGNGRSGLATQMAAMRLMHFGLRVHVVGEVTAPAITGSDLLIAVSGSGTTATVVNAAETAKKTRASVLAVTTAPESPLANLADVVLVLPAADKQDHSASITRQYSGSLFEQSVLLAFDALFQALWNAHGQTADRLWERHANLG